MFSAAPQRWEVLKQYVNVTLKSWSKTRWESRISSVEAVRYQSSDIRKALIQIRDKATDATIRLEAQELAEEIGPTIFKFVQWSGLTSFTK
ncbi:hypothetical protein LDENG_00219860 [Lucifuga dentata]|nr:hypothetical protein LDENG_00219860 [Lucifuga dentata]